MLSQSLRAAPGKFQGVINNQDGIQTPGLELIKSLFQAGYQLWPGTWQMHVERMGPKSYGHRFSIGRAWPLHECVQEHLMSAVDTIKVSNYDHCFAKIFGNLI